jgi:hypothetical protein
MSADVIWRERCEKKEDKAEEHVKEKVGMMKEKRKIQVKRVK